MKTDYMEEKIEKYRQWQKSHPEWELYCDMDNTDHHYVQWNELPKAERMSWIGTFGRSARDAFEEFAIKKCKVPHMVLGEDLQLYNVLDWPSGFCMTVYKTDNKADSADT